MKRAKNCKKCGGKMQQGGLSPYTQANTPAGAITPTGQSSLSANSPLTVEQLQDQARRLGFRTDSNVNLQQDMMNYALQNQPDAYNKVMSNFGQTAAGRFDDGSLGARTFALMQQLTPQAPPTPQQAALTEWMYDSNKHAIGQASQRYRDSQSASDPGIQDVPEYIDFMYNKRDSQELDSSRGRYRIPYNVWSNQVTRGSTTIQDPSILEQYAYPPNQTKLQRGGLMYEQQQREDQLRNLQLLAPPNPLDNIVYPNSEPLASQNMLQQGIQKGIIQMPENQQFPINQEPPWYQSIIDPQKKKKYDPQSLQNIGIGLKAARTGLGYFAGMVERGRQNQYDYTQQAALGQMNPMPLTDFQPNPFQQYAKYGGNLKSIMKDYQKWTNDAQFDFGSGDNDKDMMKKGGYEIDRMLIVRKFLPELLKFGRMSHKNYEKGGLSRSEDYGSEKKPYPNVSKGDFAGGNRSYPIPTRADAVDALRLAGLHGRDDVRAKVYAKYPDLKKLHGGNTAMEPYHNLPPEQYQRMLEMMNEGYHMMPDGTMMANSEMKYKKGGNYRGK